MLCFLDKDPKNIDSNVHAAIMDYFWLRVKLLIEECDGGGGE